MKLSSQIKPVSYLKMHVSEIFRQPGVHGELLIITQNSEAKAILQDIQSYEKQQETMALLKMPGAWRRFIYDFL